MLVQWEFKTSQWLSLDPCNMILSYMDQEGYEFFPLCLLNSVVEFAKINLKTFWISNI